MTLKKRTASGSTSGSSSGGSSSDSSSSGSSSSGSDSSSSSDTDSSSSQDEQTPATSKPTTTTETNKKPVTNNKPVARKSTESNVKVESKKEDSKPTPKVKVPSKVTKTKPSNVSSEEDNGTKNSKQPVKRKPPAKPKSTATVTPKVAPPKTTRSKTPPKSTTKSTTVSKPVIKNDKVKQQTDKKLNKMKSIFSPENSSESDSPMVSKLTPMKSQAKIVSQKPRQKVSPRPSVDKPQVKSPEKAKPKEEKKISNTQLPKAKSSTDSSASSESTDSSSASDSDSSAESENDEKKTVNNKKPRSNENEPSKKAVTRKLTRSASARKSKHVIGKSIFTDTDSDTESTKRSLTRSPVKRPSITKGKTKNSKRTDSKSKPADSIIITEERKCPIESCDSVGHLSGKYDKHFTVEACPLYHNMSAQKCKEAYAEWKKGDDEHKKLIESYLKSPRASQNSDQKAYLHKIREIRAKFKCELSESDLAITDKNKEPELQGIVPEYDLKLFRDAQAIASEKIEDDLKKLPHTKGTKYIEMGKFEMEVWYQSPYPEDYARLPKLYLCEYCLRYMKSATILQRHISKCVWRHPPGEEVYRKDKICVWEVDGKKYKLYCQNLCLLAKFFLDHKTLYYDVEPFLFYVMTIMDSEGCHTVGYFSKEKNSFLNYNVSCILTLPPYQRQGYGRLLIDFSYLLTRVEGKIGSPEKPLSDLGLISYRSYWKDVLLAYLCAHPGTQLCVKDVSQEMAINSSDIVSTLQALGMMKYWKGKHIILKKQDVLDEYVEKVKRRGPLAKEIDPEYLRWRPFETPPPAAP